MPQKRKLFVSFFILLLLTFLSVQATFAYSNVTLRNGMRGDAVSKLQQDLKTLGFMSIGPTGYFGDITESAVLRFQKHYGLTPDGIAGIQTYTMIDKLLGRTTAVSRGDNDRKNPIQLLPWFEKADGIYAIGDTAVVTDVDTGLTFRAKRTYGYNHADVETLTAEDTKTLRKIAGGYWNWTRRAVIVEIDGLRIAASMTAMPHAGRDDEPANVYVSDRSDGYGYGVNLDSVKGNDMDGQFDIHFYGSKTHATNRVDEEHQAMVQKAYKSGL